MLRPSKSDLYHTKYLAWPDSIISLCNLCKSPLKFAHPGSGKLVHTLNGDIHQVLYYYSCSNEKCENCKRYFNPTPRYDYSKNYYGQDVINRISREIQVFKQNPEQIYLRLTLDYSLKISLRTVERIYNDCIMLKAKQIDEKTEKETISSEGIIMAADAQDPGQGKTANWLFTDCNSGRVLKTVQADSMPSNKLQGEINEILREYDTKLLGFVSDKQNSIVKCIKDFFPGIPHQYCTWHFTNHLWKHLEVFDTQIYNTLKSIVNSLSIHKRSVYDSFNLKNHGKIPFREIFSDIDEDFQKMLRYRSKKFEKLRGLPLYRTLKKYVLEMQKTLKTLPIQSRFYIVLDKAEKKLTQSLQSLQTVFFEDLFMYDTFKIIYQLFYHSYLEKANRIQKLDDIFGKCWAVARIKNSALIMENLRAFNPTSSSSCSEILGEWVRLWNSYLPGLFSYYDFSIDRRTNIAQEQAFSIEISDINRRMANSEVSYMQELQGEFYLRFSHCSDEELQKELVSEYMDVEIQTLRAAYHQKVNKITNKWFYRAESLDGLKITLEKYGDIIKQTSRSKFSKKKKRISHKSLKDKIRNKTLTRDEL